MKKKHISKSLGKYIRKEKARIRRQALDFKEERELIDKLYNKISHDNKGDLQSSDPDGN